MRWHQWLGRLAFAAVLLCQPGLDPGRAAEPQPVVIATDMAGPIGPAAVRHLEQTLAHAAERNAEALVLQINTPGGLATSMREIISLILGAPLPVIGYVTPPGAHAASAGTYILYATHLAAMAPGTNLGAATPVQIGGMPGTPGKPPPAGQGGDRDGGERTDMPDRKRLAPDDPMQAKAVNDAVALIRGLAEMRGRNADWAERAVREAESLSATEARDRKVVELVAEDLPRLLSAADGRTVKIGGSDHTLATGNAVVERFEPDAMTRILGVLSNPNVALVLMMIGVYGIILEFWSPGAVAPGVIGAISLTLALYALNQLPLDYAGLALIVLGIAFMVAETLSPAFGILGFGGMAAFVMGAAMLIDTDEPAYQISWWLIGTMAAISGAVLILLLGYTLRIYRARPEGGGQALIGATARVIDWTQAEGHVWVDGERWRATGTALAPGDLARIRALDGLTLIVDRAEDDAGAQGDADRKGEDA